MYRLILTDPLLTHSLENTAFPGRFREAHEKGMGDKPMPFNHLRFIAGDRIRTGDVQLGKQTLLFSEKLGKPLFTAV